MSTFLFFLPFLLIYTVLRYTPKERCLPLSKPAGPMEVGYKGLVQTVADLLKLIQKEDIIPAAADKLMFVLGPVIIFVSVFAGFAVLPLTSGFTGSTAEVGVFYLLAIVSLDVIGIMMAGWGSNSKYSLFGAMRSVAQIVSYEIPLGLSVLCVVMIAQSFNLQEISFQQGIWINFFNQSAQEIQQNYLFGIKALGINTTEIGGFLTWNIFRVPFFFIAYIIFFIASLAESNRRLSTYLRQNQN